MSGLVQFPGAGCVVEYLLGNELQIAWILEEQKGRLRLLHQNRKEASMAASRLLPWSSPSYAPAKSKDEIADILARHKERRESLAAQVSPVELWEMAQGEVSGASAEWFAELAWSDPDVDAVAACGRALLQCKSHFKFQPPVFEVYSAEAVEMRKAAEEAMRRREALVKGGAEWLRRLWDAAQGRAPRPDPAQAPDEPVRSRLERMIRAHIAGQNDAEDDALWKQVAKGLPDDPFLPLLLGQAWGIVPPHYDFWLDRADYEAGTAWESAYAAETENLVSKVESSSDMPPATDMAFISIDSSSTRDIDDAFHIEQAEDGGWNATVALACPALFWNFGGELDKAVAYRATSLYLPEATSHMMPETISEGAFSLFAGKRRPALLIHVHVSPDGEAESASFETAAVCLADNLDYAGCEAALDGQENRSSAYAGQLRMAVDMSRVRIDCRVRHGAVIIEKPELEFSLEGEGESLSVHIEETPPAPRSMLLVSELMILANAALAQWASERGIPMLYRTQDIAVPHEFAGIWRDPADVVRVVRSLVAASLDTVPRPHVGIGLPAYSPVTSPLRRYADLVNEAQLLHVLSSGAPLWNAAELEALKSRLSVRLDAAGQVQRLRLRYWKYLYIQQQAALHGCECCWQAEVTEENESWVCVNLPQVQIGLRARRKIFGEKVFPGQKFMVRLGKIEPLRGEAFILEAREC